MLNPKEEIIKIALKQIEDSTTEMKESAVKHFLNVVVDLYKSDYITSEQLGYYVTSLVQYEDIFTNSQIFTEITKTAGFLELPTTQLEEKGFNRKQLLETLLNNITRFVN